MLLLMGFIGLRAYADELPKSLLDAIAQVQTEEAEKAFGVLRRYAYTDNQEQRLVARTALAQLDREAGRLDRAVTWVEDYQNPQPENFEWPRINAYVESAKIQFKRGNAFESVKRLTDANDKSSGLAKVSVERALSWVVEQKPDLKQALDYEKSALKSGEGYFKRKKISDTAGLEPAKAGTEIWKELKPEIETRIADLERQIRIDSYGLDFVLYSEAQEFRNASHPLALDFTNVGAAFNQKGDIGGEVPDADYEMAAYRYNEIVEFFPNNPYGQVATLYLAVCTAKTGDPDDAIKQLKAFYKEDPDGLYRGEALKLMGDLYLFAKWDKANAREAYERSNRWVEATEKRDRVLETYLVPEKSKEVSKPPKVVKILTKEGGIKSIEVPKEALVNRVTSSWYLEYIFMDNLWRLGFLAVVDDNWDEAFQSFDRILDNDRVLKSANQQNYFNPYDRLKVAKNKRSMVGTYEQSMGLTEGAKVVIFFADINLLMGEFKEALSIYKRVQEYSENDKGGIVYSRSVLGEMLAYRNLQGLDKVKDLVRMNDVVTRFPKSPSAPYLLEMCALIASGDPHPPEYYFKKIYTDYPLSSFAPRAMYNEILRNSGIYGEEYLSMKIELFNQSFPNSLEYIEALNEYMLFVRSMK